MTIKEMKAELKALAIEIRSRRQAFRAGQRAASLWENSHPNWQQERWDSPLMKERSQARGDVLWPPDSDSNTYRYKHVVYCLARGRTYEQIEPKVREGNEIDMERVKAMLAGVTREPEAVRPSA